MGHKPEDIPQDVWQRAEHAWNEIHYSLMMDGGPEEVIARALLHERGLCAKTAVNFSSLFPHPQSDLSVGFVAGAVGAAAAIERGRAQ